MGPHRGAFGRRGRKKGLSTSFQTEIAQEVQALMGRQAIGQLDLEALETAARRGALRLAAAALQQQLNRDGSDYTGPQRACACGEQARYVDRRRKVFHSVLGPLELERAYYHCRCCGQGGCPRDHQLGLENTSLSPAVTRMIGTVGALVSFQEGSQLLEELAGVVVDAKRVERTAETLGAEVAAYEKQDEESLHHTSLPPTLYLGIDGTGVPMRPAEVAGRVGKQADGSAKTREVKLCTLWSAETRDAEGRPVRDEGSVSYSAAIESAATLDVEEVPSLFTQRVLREARRRRFTAAERTVVLGDGAPWIWNIAQELFPRALQIVDRFHVKEHLSTVAKAIYGADSPQAKAWAQRRHQELETGRFPALLGAVRRQAERCDEARKCVEYLLRNRKRMRYPDFEAQGLCTSTGVVEAGCKVVIGTRLKRAGMHWTVAGANAIIALRCSKLSGRFQDFWERRCEQKRAA
jgi:hypothetical protein